MNGISKRFPHTGKPWQLYLAISMGCFLFAMLLSQGKLQKQREDLAASLSPSVLRFHILADSDNAADQQVKLEVRSLVLDYLKEHLPEYPDKQDTISCLSENQKEIEQLANDYLKQRGFDYRTSLQLTHCYFPTRRYGKLVFPCGFYDAARITLGKGSGHNWWCVLYPQFCFVDAACTAVPQESARLLQRELGEEGYLALQDNRPEVQIRFRLFPHLTLNPPKTGAFAPQS